MFSLIGYAKFTDSWLCKVCSIIGYAKFTDSSWLCGMFYHVTNDCWNLPSNAHKRPAYFAMRSEEEANVLDDESATAECGIAD